MPRSMSATGDAKIVAILGPCVGEIGYELVDMARRSAVEGFAEADGTQSGEARFRLSSLPGLTRESFRDSVAMGHGMDAGQAGMTT